MGKNKRQEYRPDYLKVEVIVSSSGIDIHELNEVLRKYKETVISSNYDGKKVDFFGLFDVAITTNKYYVLKFEPLSRDVDNREGIKYKTRKDALNAAVKYLENRGFAAKAFNLEGLIDSI